MAPDKIIPKIYTLEECKKIAADYCKKVGYRFGKYEGKRSGGYCFEAEDPNDDGKIVGYPLHVIVDKVVGKAFEDRF